MRFLIGALAPLALLLTSPVWGQDYLYQARPVAQGEQPPSADGVLVREVLVKKGDTLSHLSKRFPGEARIIPRYCCSTASKSASDLSRQPAAGAGQQPSGGSACHNRQTPCRSSASAAG